MELPPDLINGEEEWEVEQVLDARLFGHNKQQQYKVWWKGYSSAYGSWELATNLHAEDLIAEFKRRHTSNIKALTIWWMKSISVFIKTPQMSFTPKQSSPPSVMKKSTTANLPIATIIPRGNIHFVDSPRGTTMVHHKVPLDVLPPIPHTCPLSYGPFESWHAIYQFSGSHYVS